MSRGLFLQLNEVPERIDRYIVILPNYSGLCATLATFLDIVQVALKPSIES